MKNFYSLKFSATIKDKSRIYYKLQKTPNGTPPPLYNFNLTFFLKYFFSWQRNFGETCQSSDFQEISKNCNFGANSTNENFSKHLKA